MKRLSACGEQSDEVHRDRIAKLNRRIAAFNLKAPARSLHKRSVEID
jgi:hypothetical protein